MKNPFFFYEVAVSWFCNELSAKLFQIVESEWKLSSVSIKVIELYKKNYLLIIKCSTVIVYSNNFGNYRNQLGLKIFLSTTFWPNRQKAIVKVKIVEYWFSKTIQAISGVVFFLLFSSLYRTMVFLYILCL